jgi:hypothetical protein
MVAEEQEALRPVSVDPPKGIALVSLLPQPIELNLHEHVLQSPLTPMPGVVCRLDRQRASNPKLVPGQACDAITEDGRAVFRGQEMPL